MCESEHAALHRHYTLAGRGQGVAGRLFRKAACARLMAELFETMPIAFVLKDAQGHIVHTNRYNAQVSGWQSPPTRSATRRTSSIRRQAAVYGGRDECRDRRADCRAHLRLRRRPLDRAQLRHGTSRHRRARTRIGTATVYWRGGSARRTGTSPSGRPLSIWTGISPSTPVESLPLSGYSVSAVPWLFRERQMTPSPS